MRYSVASTSRTSGADVTSRRMALTEARTSMTATTTTTTTPSLLARSRTAATAPPRRLLALPAPRASFLDGLLQTGNKKKASPLFQPPNAAALSLVESLLAAVEGTDAGAADNTSEAQRLEIARLASSLKKYRMRNPAQSPLLWGRYRVSYCR
jgi:hypothetical protein